MSHVVCSTTIDELDRLRLPWHALWCETRDASLFQTYAWFRAARRHVPGRWLVLEIREGRKTAGLLPLRLVHTRSWTGRSRVLNFPLPSWAPTFGPIGPEPTRIWLEVLEYLQCHRRRWDRCDWRGIDVAHVDFNRLETAGKFRGIRFRKTQETHWKALDPAEDLFPRCIESTRTRPERGDESLRVARRLARRPRIINAVHCEDVAPPEVMLPARAQVVRGMHADRESGWLTAMMRTGAATGDVIRYECSRDGVIVGEWWIARGRDHWAVVGRWAANRKIEPAIDHAIWNFVSEDARKAQALRLWFQFDRPRRDDRSPVRFRFGRSLAKYRAAGSL